MWSRVITLVQEMSLEVLHSLFDALVEACGQLDLWQSVPLGTTYRAETSSTGGTESLGAAHEDKEISCDK